MDILEIEQKERVGPRGGGGKTQEAHRHARARQRNRVRARRAAQSRPRLHGVYSLREGKIVRMDEHSVRAQALEAAGLSE